MRRIAHLSDLHFGREDPAVVAALAEDLRQVQPHLVVVSGDVTQRARRAEFESARRFLLGLAAPVVCVPGNHDVPLFNLGRRLWSPKGRYRKHLGTFVADRFQDGEVAVLGLDTSHGLTWKSGRVDEGALHSLRIWSAGAGRRLRLVVAHHPFVQDPDARHSVVRGVDPAWRALEEAGIDVLLTGHLHRASHRDARSVRPGVQKSFMVLHCGTSTSVRRRGEANAYNLLHLAGPALAVEVRGFAQGRFASLRTAAYVRRELAWVPDPPGPQHAAGVPPPAGPVANP